jgi:hypothetical protein
LAQGLHTIIVTAPRGNPKEGETMATKTTKATKKSSNELKKSKKLQPVKSLIRKAGGAALQY